MIKSSRRVVKKIEQRGLDTSTAAICDLELEGQPEEIREIKVNQELVVLKKMIRRR